VTRQQVDPDAARAPAVALDLRVLMGKLRRRLRETGHAGDLTWSQTSVLAHLESEGPATVTTLARAQGVRPQSMGANVAVLEAAGLISGAPDPTDGRQPFCRSPPLPGRRSSLAGRQRRTGWLGRARSLVLTILGGALLVGTPALTANPFVIGAAFVVGGTTSSSATSSRCPCGSGSPPPGCWGA